MITIFLRKITGKGQKLQVNPKITSSTLIKQVYKSFNYPTVQDSHDNQFNRISCFYRGSQIRPNSQETIEDIGITTNSIIHILQKDSQINENKQSSNVINIKLIINNRLLEYEIDLDNRIEDLKQNICEDLSIKEEDLTLSYLGLQLDSSKTVKEYSFSDQVLLSAFASGEIDSAKFGKSYSVSKESYSQESQAIPKIVRKDSPPLKKRIKKAQSLNVQPVFQPKNKNSNFCSVRLNKIEQKHDDESKIQSQINESQEKSQEQSQQEINNLQWQKPKMTLDLLSKPWYGDQKIIQTESIVGDDDSQEICAECLLQLTRVDKKRQYVLQCGSTHTFQDALNTLARLQKLQVGKIKFLFSFDDVSKSAISSQSSKGINKSPKSSQAIKKRSSYEGRFLSPRIQGMNAKIIQNASKAKSKLIKIEYEINDKK